MSEQLATLTAETNYNSFDQIATWVPEELKANYWRLLSQLKTVAPGDDILKVIETMGILTVIARQIPSELAIERIKFREEIAILQNQMEKLSERVMDQSSRLAMRLEEIQSVSNATSGSLDQFSQQVEETLKTAASRVDVKALSEAFSSELREKAIEPIQQIDQELEVLQKRLASLIPKIEASVGVLKKARWWIPWLVASAVCTSVAMFSWYKYRDSFNWVGFCQTFQSAGRSRVR